MLNFIRPLLAYFHIASSFNALSAFTIALHMRRLRNRISTPTVALNVWGALSVIRRQISRCHRYTAQLCGDHPLEPGVILYSGPLASLGDPISSSLSPSCHALVTLSPCHAVTVSRSSNTRSMLHHKDRLLILGSVISRGRADQN